MVDSLKEGKEELLQVTNGIITHFLGLFKVGCFAISVEMKSELVHIKIHIEYRALFNMKSTP
jgi:hypothetical protein